MNVRDAPDSRYAEGSSYLFHLEAGHLTVFRSYYDEIFETDPSRARYLELLQEMGKLAIVNNGAVAHAEPPYEDFRYLLTAKNVPAQVGTYERITGMPRTAEDGIIYGYWLKSVVPLTQLAIRRSYQLGIGLGENRLLRVGRHKSFLSYVRSVGEKPKQRRKAYAEWSDEQVTDYVVATLLEKDKDETLIDAINRKALNDEGPGRTAIRRIDTRLTNLLLKRGYYYEVSLPSEELIKWGVRVRHANEGRPLTRTTVRVLNKRYKGPSEVPIKRQFTNHSSFTKEVDVVFKNECETIQTHIDQIRKEVRKESAEFRQLVESPVPLPLRLHRVLQFYLIDRILPNAPDWYKVVVAKINSSGKLVSALQQNSLHLTPGLIYGAAKELGIYQRIFEEDLSYLEHLRLGEHPDEELY